MPTISDQHPDYVAYKDRWNMIADFLDGEAAVKQNSDEYLPFPVSLPAEQLDTDDYRRQYEIYLEGAQFVEFTSQAVEDLVASVFSRDAIIGEDLPTDLDYLDLNMIAREAARELMAFGRCLVLADYPMVEGRLTKQQEQEQAIHAYVTTYNALEIINWETSRVGGKLVLLRVVIQENVIQDNEYVVQFRELTVEDGTYTVNLYDSDENVIETTTPTAGSNRLDHIPGVFIGVVANDTTVDKPPVLGIATANLKHYQTTAELRHALTYMGHPMLVITGAPHGFLDQLKEAGARVSIGASNALILEGEMGKADILQISSQLQHFEELKRLEVSMTEMGYRLKSEKSGVEAAEALRIRNSGQTSQLASIASQIERGVQELLVFLAEFMETAMPEEFTFDLVKDYIQEPPDSTILEKLDGLVNTGRVPDWVLYDYMSDVNLLSADVDYDVLREEAEPLKLPGLTDNAVDEGVPGAK